MNSEFFLPNVVIQTFVPVLAGEQRATTGGGEAGGSLSPAIIKVNRATGEAGGSYTGAGSPADVCEVGERTIGP